MSMVWHPPSVPKRQRPAPFVTCPSCSRPICVHLRRVPWPNLPVFFHSRVASSWILGRNCDTYAPFLQRVRRPCGMAKRRESRRAKRRHAVPNGDTYVPFLQRVRGSASADRCLPPASAGRSPDINTLFFSHSPSAGFSRACFDRHGSAFVQVLACNGP